MKNKSMIRGRPPECLLTLPAFVLMKAGQFVEQRLAESFASLPLRSRHVSVLRVLINQGPVTQQELCEFMWIDRASMTGLIKTLLNRGLVQRRNHASDKRSLIVGLTPAGEAYYAEHGERLHAVERELFRDFPVEDVRRALELLSRALVELAD